MTALLNTKSVDPRIFTIDNVGETYMTWTISRDGIIYCVTSVPYPPYIIRDMKQAGYKITTEK